MKKVILKVKIEVDDGYILDKPSEDELTWLKTFIKEEAYYLSMDIRDEVDREKLIKLQNALAWLEKQGEQKPKDKYTFNSIPRLLSMIEPTDMAKSFNKLDEEIRELKKRINKLENQKDYV